MKARLLVLLALGAVAALVVAGCGGSSDSGGKDPAEAAPPDSTVFIAGSIKPDGEVAENVEELAQKLAGVDDLGALIAEEIDKETVANGAKIDFEKEIEPLLGEKAGFFLSEYDGDEFNGGGFALQVEDEGEAEDLIEEKSKEAGESFEEEEYEGVDFQVQEDGSAFGFTEGLLIFGQEEKAFKEAVNALDGENLAGQDKYTEAAEEVPDGSVADVYVDIGGLVEEAGQETDQETELGLEILGIEPEGSTALISLVPGSNNLELDVSSDVATGPISGGDASELLGSLPAGSVVALSSSEFGKGIEEIINRIDKNGIPGQIEPGEFKKALEAQGIDLDSIVGSLGDIGFFVEGNSERNLGGAVVIQSKDPSEAQNTVRNLGLILRSTGTPGVTAISESGVSGFSIPNEELGGKPIVVAAGKSNIAIALGPKAAVAALSGKGGTLADSPVFKEAKEALGDTPISGFVSGQTALTLINGVASPLEAEELAEAKPYLEKVGYVAIGGSSSGDKSQAKLIVGLAK